MSEPSLICSAPEIADSAQKIALYSHYAAAVAGFVGGGVLLMRSRVQEKIPHILMAIAAFGVGFAALYSQWSYNLYLFKHFESASSAIAPRAGLWLVWGTLLFVALSMTPGFRFKKMGKRALIPLIAFTVLAAVGAAVGDWFSAKEMTAIPPASELGNLVAYADKTKSEAFRWALVCGIPALVCAVLAVGAYIFSQLGKADPKLGRFGENLQQRSGVMLLVAVVLPLLIYAAAPFIVASGEQGAGKAILLFNCCEVLSIFFLICSTMSLLGVPANFPKPKKKEKKKEKAAEAAPAAETPTVLDQQQAYAQAYAQQLYAQQQAYAQYYAQQQAAAATQAQQNAPQAQSAPQTPAPAGTPDAAALAAYQQQQAQYYAQQQAYAAYQQQQQMYQQQYAAQQQYAQPQQQVYAQAYAQQQEGLRKNQTAMSIKQPKPAAPRVVQGGVKKVGGVRPIKKIR